MCSLKGERQTYAYKLFHPSVMKLRDGKELLSRHIHGSLRPKTLEIMRGYTAEAASADRLIDANFVDLNMIVHDARRYDPARSSL